MNNNLFIPLKKEFKALFLCARQTIGCIPETEWRRGGSKRSVPVWQAVHMLMPLLDPIRHRKEVVAPLVSQERRFRKKVKSGDFPTQAEVVDFIEAVEPLVYQELPEVIERSCQPNPMCNPPLNRWLYTLRHSIIHLSYMRHDLIERGISVPEYIKYVARIMRS